MLKLWNDFSAMIKPGNRPISDSTPWMSCRNMWALTTGVHTLNEYGFRKGAVRVTSPATKSTQMTCKLVTLCKSNGCLTEKAPWNILGINALRLSKPRTPNGKSVTLSFASISFWASRFLSITSPTKTANWNQRCMWLARMAGLPSDDDALLPSEAKNRVLSYFIEHFCRNPHFCSKWHKNLIIKMLSIKTCFYFSANNAFCVVPEK